MIPDLLSKHNLFNQVLIIEKSIKKNNFHKSVNGQYQVVTSSKHSSNEQIPNAQTYYDEKGNEFDSTATSNFQSMY